MTLTDVPRHVLNVADDEQNPYVLTVTINNPENRLNLWDYATIEEFAALFNSLRADTRYRAVLITAAGEHFCGGGHFELMDSQSDPEKVEYLARLTRRLYSDMLDVAAPIVCALNGPAVGAGCSVALLSDILVASQRATLSDPHVCRGLTAGLGVAIWSLYLGPVRLKRFLLTGEVLDSHHAHELGMVDFICDDGETLTRALELARNLASNPPLAVAKTKLLANKHIRATLEVSFAMGAAWQSQDFHTHDHKEAVAAFRERRSPVYTGR